MFHGLVKADFLKMARLPRDMQSHLEIYNAFCKSEDEFASELLFKPTQISELVICSKDRPSLLYSFSTVLAFNNLSIVEANIHTLRDHIFDVFKIVRPTGIPIDYADIFSLQRQVRDDLKRVCVDQESPCPRYLKIAHFPFRQSKKKLKPLKLKVKIIGRSVKVETHDLIGNLHDPDRSILTI